MRATKGLSTNCIDAIRDVVGESHVSDATPQDAIDGVASRYIVEPASAEQLAQVLSLANAAGLRVIPRGGGTKLDWGNPPSGVDLILSTKRMDRILEHAAGDMTATVQAGCTVAAFNRKLAERGQRLALDPLWPDSATIGGIIATNDSGALRLAYGTLRDHLIGITVALADGTLARSGGKVVKNVAGYDLPKLFTGSFGTLGVITEATFRLYPMAHATRVLRFAVPTSEVLGRVLTALGECSLVTSAVQIEAAFNSRSEITVVVEGLSGAIGAKAQRVEQAALAHGAEQIDGALTATEPALTVHVGRPMPANESLGGPCPPYTGGFENPVGSAPRTAPPEIGPQCGPYVSRESLFSHPESCVAKFSLLPTQLPAFLDHVSVVINRIGLPWRIIAQSIGVGLISLSGPQIPVMLDTLLGLRRHLTSLGGSLTLLRCPLILKRQIDVWPDVGSVLPLMRQIKHQFDPNGILSPGRFVGGI